MSDTTKVLFVCTGNICRSAFAEAAVESMFGSDTFTFASAGMYAIAGNHATSHMQTVASEHGFDLSSHRATPLDACDEPDVVFGMEQLHLVAARAQFPHMNASDIRLLDHPINVPDPYGENLTEYRSTADQIVEALTSLDMGMSH